MFSNGMGLTGSIPVFNFQGLSLKLYSLYFDDEYSHQDSRAGHGAQERVMVVGRVCCEGEGHLNENSVLLEGR